MSEKKNWEQVSKGKEEETEEKAQEALEMTTGTVPELSEELAVAQAEAKKNYELVLRKQAEFENLEKRLKKEIEDQRKYGIRKLVEEIVPVLDSFDQGMQSKIEIKNEAVEQLKTGMKMTYTMLLNTLKKHGVEQINPEGELFNPELHEAMSMVEDPDFEKNTIITVFQKGYLLHGRLLRPARVILAK